MRSPSNIEQIIWPWRHICSSIVASLNEVGYMLLWVPFSIELLKLGWLTSDRYHEIVNPHSVRVKVKLDFEPLSCLILFVFNKLFKLLNSAVPSEVKCTAFIIPFPLNDEPSCSPYTLKSIWLFFRGRYLFGWEVRQWEQFDPWYASSLTPSFLWCLPLFLPNFKWFSSWLKVYMP